MNKKEFCLLLLRYIDDGFTKLDIETEYLICGFDFDEDTILLSKDYFVLEEPGVPRIKIHYKNVKRISC